MLGVVRISEAATLGLHAMALMAAEGERPARVRDMAKTFGASQAHLAKVLQRLAHAGLASGTRGPAGGFILTAQGARATLLKIYEAIEGPLAEAQCLLNHPVCGGGEHCMLGGLVREVNERIRHDLANTRLSDVATTSSVFHKRLNHETKNSKD